MSLIGTILLILLRIFVLMLVARLITEMIQSFSKEFRPPRWFIMIIEPIFVATDPPVKALRKLIPPLRTGGVSLDVSVIVLFIIVMILQAIVRTVFF